MLENKITKKIGNIPEINNLPKETINGELGEITIYKKDLTKQQAETEYNKIKQQKDYYWRTCKVPENIAKELDLER